MTRRLYRVRTKSIGTTAWRITDTDPTPELLECLEFEPLHPANVGRGLRYGLGLGLFFWTAIIGGITLWLP